jgi:hypothetical protein
MEHEWIKTMRKIDGRRKALLEFKEKIIPLIDEIEKKLNMHPIISSDNCGDFIKLENEFIRFGSYIKIESKILASNFKMDKNKE